MEIFPSQGLKYRRIEAFPLIEWNETSRQERKCKSDLGVREKDGVCASIRRQLQGVHRGLEKVPIGCFNEYVCATSFSYVCLSVWFTSSCLWENVESVDANATLVGGWLFRRPVIYRPSCA